MNEIPERMEREMFEIRSRMAPDVRDLKKHVEPQAVSRKLTTRIKERARAALTGTVRSLVESARRQAGMVGEAGRKRNPSELTDAVKSDPRPLAILAITLALTLLTVRRISNGRGD